MTKASKKLRKALAASLRRKKHHSIVDEDYGRPIKRASKKGHGDLPVTVRKSASAVITKFDVIKGRLQEAITAEARKTGFNGTVTLASGSVKGTHDRVAFVATPGELAEACERLVSKGIATSYLPNDDGSVSVAVTPRAAVILSGKRVARFRTPVASDKSAAHEQDARKLARPDRQVIERLIDAVSGMDAYKLLAAWKNAVRMLADPSRKSWHTDARRLADAISREWDRRGTGAPGDAWFKWPETDAPGGGRKPAREGFRTEGMLAYLEYKVGRNGEAASYRQVLLDRIFAHSLPPVFDKPYMAEWGMNGSSVRLHKMAHCLASFARNAKYRDDDRLDEAIKDWEQDLQYLHDKFYVGKFGFGWPSSSVF